jgi:hypothetical protein
LTVTVIRDPALRCADPAIGGRDLVAALRQVTRRARDMAA